jgi:IS5 family transposase
MATGKRRAEEKMQMSFGTLELSQRLKRDGVLMKIDGLIDWEKLRPQLTGLYKRELSHGARTGTV